MVAQTKRTFITPLEYLQRERNAETKSEYDDGVIVAMAGASPEHVSITYNVGAELRLPLRRAGCRGFPIDLRVRIDACNKYYYPDFAVACGQPVYEIMEGMRSLRNPTLIVEVLSDSTEQQDRGEKSRCYRTLESLSTYVLVTRDRSYIEVLTRLEGGGWKLSEVEGPEATLNLQAIGCEIKLAEIYADVEFGESE